MAITRRQRLVIGYSIFGSSNVWKILIRKSRSPVENLPWRRSVLDTAVGTIASSERIAKCLLYQKLIDYADTRSRLAPP
jgi:hypothetical protein